MSKKASIRSRAHTQRLPSSFGTSLLALGAAVAPLAAHAQAAGDSGEVKEVSVKASRINPYKADESASNKITQPLIDTPKTIQVIKKEVFKEQGAASLMDALRNTPGITMQLGENGNTSAGDAFQMRGFSTQTSTFVDGVRDLGAITRDVFNLEQVEVVKGPAGSDIGRGAASGYINLITKLPTRDDANEVNFTLGTADKKRATADISRSFGESGAFRINVMTQDSGVDGRDWVRNKGSALAPSLAFGLGTPTRVYLYSQHIRQHNRPDGGIPTIGMSGFFRTVTATGSSATNATQAAAITAAGRVDRNNYYGSVNDYENVNADMFTAKVEHDLGQKTTLRNLTRYGKTHMDRVLTGISATINGSNVSNLSDPSTWTVGRSRQRTDQTNEILVNQTSLNSEFMLGGVQHNMAAGAEFMYERQMTKGTGTDAQTIRGVSYAAIANPNANLYAPNPYDVLGVPYLTGVDTDGKTLTAAIYALDTVTINPQWKINGGVRFERYSASTNSGIIVTNSGNNPNFPIYGPQGYSVGSVVPVDLNDSRNLTSWNLGVVYKPAENGSVYAAMANSLTPPGSANFSLSATATNQASPTMDPQETKSIEVGTKWDLLNKRLNLTAALYRTENDKQTSQDPSTGTTFQFGKTRVQGFELGAVGQLTNFWQLSAGLATMKTRQLDQYSVSATTGVSNSNAVRWSPEFTASVWTSYTLDQWTFGTGARHVSEQKRVVTAGTNLATENMPNIKGYTVFDAMVSYKVSKNVNLQLNVYNLFDKEYVGSLNNSGGRMVLGAPRTVALTASLKF